MSFDPSSKAALVESFHAPWPATVADCLARWRSLDERTRARAYLVVETDPSGLRRTLNAAAIAELAASCG